MKGLCATFAAFLLSAPPLAPQPPPATGVEGSWQGILHTQLVDMPLLLTIAKSGNRYSGSLKLRDYAAEIPVTRIRVNGQSLRFELKDKVYFDGTSMKGFNGSLDAARSTLAGSTLGEPKPLTLTRYEIAPAPGQPMSVDVPFPPAVLRGGDRTHLVYELRIANQSEAPASVQRIGVVGNGPLASFEGPGLERILPSARIPGLTTAFAYIWITLEPGASIPARIRHNLTFDRSEFEGAPAAIASAQPLVLGPPLRGADWIAANGPHNDSFHRRVTMRIGETQTIAQRFAIDWWQFWPDGKEVRGSARNNSSYRAYGSAVLAVADATVAAVKDGIPDNVPRRKPAVPVTLATVAGNSITLDLGHGRFALYAHLQPGSLRVKTGDRVTRGQVIALVGNSGNSNGPHLHIQVTDANTNLASEGLPYVIDSFEIHTADKRYEPRQLQIPLADEIVRFSAPDLSETEQTPDR